MDEEIWLPAVGFEQSYDVSSHGRVRVRMTHELKGQTRTKAYLRVTLYQRIQNATGRRRSMRVHTLVADAFLGPRPEKFQVRHLDGVATNNHVSNLAYGTRSENMLDRRDHGTVRNANTGKTHCVRDHEFNPTNTYVTSDGKRKCKTCAKLREEGLRDGTWETVYKKTTT